MSSIYRLDVGHKIRFSGARKVFDVIRAERLTRNLPDIDPGQEILISGE